MICDPGLSGLSLARLSDVLKADAIAVAELALEGFELPVEPGGVFQQVCRVDCRLGGALGGTCSGSASCVSTTLFRGKVFAADAQGVASTE